MQRLITTALFVFVTICSVDAQQRSLVTRAREHGGVGGIQDAELEVMQAALDRAAVLYLDDAARASIPTLTVVGRCECGCASIDFGAPASHERSTVAADATGRTLSGATIISVRSDFLALAAPL